MNMKNLFLLLVCGLCFQSVGSFAQGYKIQVNIPQMSNKQVILANYFEGKVYAVDTAQINSNGTGYFQKNNKKLARGMYILLFSPSNYFDIMIGDNQNFSITTDTLQVIDKIRFEGSPENTAFLGFQKVMTSATQKSRQIKEAMEKDPAKTSPEAKKKYSARFDQIDKEVRDHIAGLCKQFPNSALATFANFTLSVPTPDFSKEIPENTPNRDFEIQKKEYLFSKAHYWDNTNFQDSTLIRTPIFKSKLDEFFNTRVLMIPDSVYKESVNIIEKSRGCKAMFRYLVSYCFNYALSNKYMGMDAAFVYLAKKYYLTGEADWVDKKTLENIEREVILTQYNLIGLKAQELKLPTMDGSVYMKPKPPLRYCSSGKPIADIVKNRYLRSKQDYWINSNLMVSKYLPYTLRTIKKNGKILLPNMNYSISSTVGILRIKLISGYTITSILLRSCISWIRKKKSSPRNWISNNLQIS